MAAGRHGGQDKALQDANRFRHLSDPAAAGINARKNYNKVQ